MNLLNRANANWILQYGHGGCDNCDKTDYAGTREPQYFSVRSGVRVCEDCFNDGDGNDGPVTVSPAKPCSQPGEPIPSDDKILSDAMQSLEIVAEVPPTACKLTPREYQVEACDAIFNSLKSDPEANPLVDMATGTGKSLVVAMCADRLVKEFNARRIVMLAPSKELVRQNYEDAKAFNPDLDISIYCAGLSCKDLSGKVIYATINSIINLDYETLEELEIDAVIADECHRFNTKNMGMNRKFTDDLQSINPFLRIIGLTATPYRLDGGLLTDPVDGVPLFTEIVYKYALGEGIEDGFLVPLRAYQQTKAFDDTKIKKVAGDFVKSELQKAWTAEKIQIAVANLMKALADDAYQRGSTVQRQHILAFCCGIQNASDIAMEAAKYGLTTAYISGEMNRHERDTIIQDFKDGKINLLTNSDILTTGFNAKNCDCIVQFRNTLSTSLYVQMLGRGSRPFQVQLDVARSREERRLMIEHSVKPDCLVLDFTSNTKRFGLVSDIDAESVKAQVDDTKSKECPECKALSAMSRKQCWCGYEFPKLEEVEHKPFVCYNCGLQNKHNAVVCVACGEDFERHFDKPFDHLGDQQWYRVKRVQVSRHRSRYDNKPDTMKVEYIGNDERRIVTEWVSLEPNAKKYALSKGRKWWIKNGGSRINLPTDVDNAISRHRTELHFPSHLAVEMNDNGFNEIKERLYDNTALVNTPLPATPSQDIPEPFMLNNKNLSTEDRLQQIGLF